MIWFLLAPLDMLVSLLAFPLAPFIVLCTSPGGIAPDWAWPWLTHDNTIDGDAGHRRRWAGRPIWRRRIAWLWRNRGYNFSFHKTGMPTTEPLRIWFGRDFWNDKDGKGWGICFATCGKAWMLFIWLPWGRLFGIERGLRVYLGWKLRGKIDHPDENPRAMLVTHINPVKGVM